MRTPLNKTIGATLSTTIGVIGLALSLVAVLAAAQPAPQAAAIAR